MWDQCTEEVAVLRDRLRSVPPEDRATWAHVARETAGAFAAWSQRVETTPGPLAATADALAKSAQLRCQPVRPKRAGMPSASGAAMLLMTVASNGQGTLAVAALMRQLANTARALYDMHRVVGEVNRAAEISTAIRMQLAGVAAKLPEVSDAPVVRVQPGEAVRIAQAGEVPPRALGSVVPTKLPTESVRKLTTNPIVSPGHDGLTR